MKVNNMKNYDILIIGAGSVGVPLSYFLCKKGKKVAVIEKAPSVGRGQNKAAIGGIRATHSDPAKIKICQRSIELTKNMEKDHGLEVEWIQGGYLFPVYDEEVENALKQNLIKQKEAGLNIDWVGPEKIQELTPGINMENLRGGTYSPEDGSASPMMLLDAFYVLAKKAGADFFFNEEVTAMEKEGNTITKIVTDKDEYSADLVVNAAGAHGGEIGKMAGLDLPIFPDSHEGGITEPVKRFFEPMIVDIRPDEQSANYYFYQNRLGQVVFCITPGNCSPC